MTMEPRDKEFLFEMLRDDLVRFYERFLGTGFKTSGILLIVLGWLVGTDSASKFFEDKPELLFGGIALLAACGVIYVTTLIILHRKSMTTLTELNELAVFEERYFSTHKISRLLFWSVIGLNEALFLFTIIVLISIDVS